MSSKRRRDRWAENAITSLLVVSIFFTLIGTKPASYKMNDTTRLNGYVPEIVRQSTFLGARAAGENLNIVVDLQPRQAQLLANLTAQLAETAQKKARTYFTPEEIAKDFAPGQSQQTAVVQFMQQAGFQLTAIDRENLLLSFQGTVGAAEQAFDTTLVNYRTPDGHIFYAPDEEPALPGKLAPMIAGIVGLDSTLQFTHRPLTLEKSSHLSENAGCPGQGKNYYLPAQLASAYELDKLYQAGYQGQGESIALVEMNDFANADITAYQNCLGGKQVSLQRIPINGGPGSPAGAGAAEVELDIETVLSAAPRLKTLRVYEANNDEVDYLTELAQIVSDDIPVVSTSWGDCEASKDAQETYQIENRIFSMAALQGETVFVASGDNGDNACNSLAPNSTSVGDPASQPDVTSVGGTTLRINARGNYLSESVWKDPDLQEGSGGGVSSLWKMPAWQAGRGVLEKGFSSGKPCRAVTGQYCREVPDVAMDADPGTGYPVYCTLISTGICNPANPWSILGGTSAGAPMWAALAALADQKAHHDGYKNLGFLNPFLYLIGQNADGTIYQQNFHDTLTGNNSAIAGNIPGYPAGPGYDMATGLGSYRALTLANSLERLIFGVKHSAAQRGKKALAGSQPPLQKKARFIARAAPR
jgi:kumamolisin